jgi:hypothetical protein
VSGYAEGRFALFLAEALPSKIGDRPDALTVSVVAATQLLRDSGINPGAGAVADDLDRFASADGHISLVDVLEREPGSVLAKTLTGSLAIPDFKAFTREFAAARYCDERGSHAASHSSTSSRLSIAHFRAENVVRIFEDVKREVKGGACASYIPALASADPSQFAVSICTVDGQQFSFGDTDATFSFQVRTNRSDGLPAVSVVASSYELVFFCLINVELRQAYDVRRRRGRPGSQPCSPPRRL